MSVSNFLNVSFKVTRVTVFRSLRTIQENVSMTKNFTVICDEDFCFVQREAAKDNHCFGLQNNLKKRASLSVPLFFDRIKSTSDIFLSRAADLRRTDVHSGGTKAFKCLWLREKNYPRREKLLDKINSTLI